MQQRLRLQQLSNFCKSPNIGLVVFSTVVWCCVFGILLWLAEDYPVRMSLVLVGYVFTSALVVYCGIRQRQDLFCTRGEHQSFLTALKEPSLVHASGQVLDVNGYALQFFGASTKSELIGLPILDFVCEEYKDVVKQRMASLVRGESTELLAEKWMTLQGEIRDVEIVAVPIQFQGYAAVQVMLRDVTERNRTEEFLRRSEKLSAVGELAAGVAHELRNPLTAISGFVQILKAKANDETVGYFDVMLREIERMNLTLGELLLLARPQMPRFEFRQVGLIVQEVLSFMTSQAKLHNVVLSFDSDFVVPQVFCDENQLKQVFINVVKNAIEAMPNGGTLAIRLFQQENWLVLQFTDTGVGIQSDHLDKLGQPFFTTKVDGTGLGMMVSQRIIQNHGGQMSFDSVPEQGTTVTVMLPQNSLQSDKIAVS